MPKDQTITTLDEVVNYRNPDIIGAAVPSTRLGEGGWSAPPVFPQTEPQPQWNTLGAALGASAGPGTDDSILWPQEAARPRSGITPVGDYRVYNGSVPARIALAIGNEVPAYASLPIRIKRAFTLVNTPDHTQLIYDWMNDTEYCSTWYEYIALHSEPSESLACALLDPSAETSVLLTFRQDSGGNVYCAPVITAPESPNNMSFTHTGNENDRYPDPVAAMAVGSPVLVTTGGLAGCRSGWTAAGYVGGDIYFSSLEAVSLGDNRVLLLNLETTSTVLVRRGNLMGRIITYDNGVITVGSAVLLAASQRNVYQAVASDSGTSTDVAVTSRDAVGGILLTLDCSGDDPAVSGRGEFGSDYSNVTWVGSRLAVLTKDCYSLSGTSLDPTSAIQVQNMFRGSDVNILLYDPRLTASGTVPVVAIIDADEGLYDYLHQTGIVQGFPDGRLFMHCSSYEPTEERVGHTYQFDGSGIRLWYVEDDELGLASITLQDQVAELDYQSSSTRSHVLRPDLVLCAGPTGFGFDEGPGEERPHVVNHFVGGVQKEANSDVQPYRISDNWLVVVEPEKNGIWWTTPGVDTPFVEELNSTLVRAIKIDDDGIPERAGEPFWLYTNWSWYSAAARINDNSFFHIGIGHHDPAAVIAGEDTYRSFFFHVLQIDELTGDLINLYETESHPLTADVITIFDLLQMGDTNRYIMLYSRIGDSSEVNAHTSGEITTSGNGHHLPWIVDDTSGSDISPSLDWPLGDYFRINTAGEYSVDISVTWNDVAAGAVNTGLRQASIVVVDESIQWVDEVNLGGAAATVGDTTRNVSGTFTIEEGHHVVIGVYQNSGSAIEITDATLTITGPAGGDSTIYTRTFELNADYSTTTLDDARVSGSESSGGVFTERKPYRLVWLAEGQYVVTWIIDDSDGAHWSAHRGVLVDGAGSMTLGQRLSADPSSADNPPYGYQGFWMQSGCGVDGRYVYPVGDQWEAGDPGMVRYPPREVIYGPGDPPSYVLTFRQKLPYALCVMEIDPVTADLTPSWYPCRVDRRTIETEWYDANFFFAPEPQRLTTPTLQRVYQAHPDGGVYQFYNTCQALPGLNPGEVWLFCGPGPVPWVLDTASDALSMALWTLDDDEQVAWYVPETWDILSVPYFVSYPNGACVMRDGVYACLATTNYYSRAAPQGWSAGFGTNLLRIWKAGAPPRGVGIATDHIRTVEHYPGPGLSG